MNHMMMPPSIALSLSYRDEAVCALPVFILVLLGKQNAVGWQNNPLFARIEKEPERILDESPEAQAEYIGVLQKLIPAEMVVPYMSCPTHLLGDIKRLWASGHTVHQELSLKLIDREFPHTINRYMTFSQERMESLLKGGKLFFPCPALFNDPFDCSLDSEMRLAMIEWAIGCYSTVPNDVLMFSHYAHSHTGVCIEFETRLLLQSLEALNRPLFPNLRPVWYCRKMPPLTFDTLPALCATCKDDIWAYEKEYRVFMVRGSTPAPYGSYGYDRNAILRIRYGCMASDATIAACKSMTSDLSRCAHIQAKQIDMQFGISDSPIQKI